jgi:hypothetical protein
MLMDGLPIIGKTKTGRPGRLSWMTLHPSSRNERLHWGITSRKRGFDFVVWNIRRSALV